MFGSERLTGALLDRLTHHVHILEMNGEGRPWATRPQRRCSTGMGMPRRRNRRHGKVHRNKYWYHRKEQQGKVQLIDATKWFTPLRRNLGQKNCELSPDKIGQILNAFMNFHETEQSKIFPNEAFGYWKVTVERPFAADRRSLA